MSLVQKIVGALSGAFAEVKASGQLPTLADTVLVTASRPDDPLLTALVADTFVTGQGGQTALGQNVLLAAAGTGALDCTNFRAIALQIVPAAGTVTAGNITFEGSNDGANWVPMPLYDKQAPYSVPITSYALAAAVPRYFIGNILFHFFRARISTGVTGTTSGVQAFSELMGTDVTFINQMVRHSDGTNLTPAGDAAARGIYIRPTDGTSAQAMKAASTPPVAADIGAVVSISPNLPAVSVYSVLAAATTNAVNIKAAAGKVMALSIINSSAAAKYVRLYNLAVAPTMGTSSPYLVVAIPATSSKEIEFGTLGINFATGIAIAITNAATDLDATAVAAGDVRVLLAYI